MTANYHVPVEHAESNHEDTINTRLSGLDSGITSVADAISNLIIDAGTSEAETIAARTFINYLAGSPPASLGLSLQYASGGIYNVLAYGAAGNGSNDDAGAIQDAIDACSSDGGGVVFLPKGTYKITVPLDMLSFVTMRGVGPKSIIDWRGTTNANAVNFGNATDAVIENVQIQNLSTVCGGAAILTGSSSARIVVRNVKIIATTITKAISSIVGNGTTLTVTASAHALATSDNVFVYGTGSTYDGQYSNITVTGANTFTDLSSINNGTLSTGTVQKMMWLDGVRIQGTDSLIENCHILTGLYVALRAYGTALRNKFTNNYVSDVMRGFMGDFEGGSGAKYNLISGNTLHLCKHLAAKIEDTAEYNIFANNNITECSKSALENGTVIVRGAHTTIENNSLFFVSALSLAAIDVDGSASHVVVKGNVISGHSGYGVFMRSGVTYTDILGNHITGGTRGIRFGASGTANITCCNNRISAVTEYGIYITALSGFVVQNNSIVAVTGNVGIYLESSCLYGSITGNMIIVTGLAGIQVGTSALPSKFISITANVIFDVGNSVSAQHILLSANQENISLTGNVCADTPHADSITASSMVNCVIVGNTTSAGINVDGGLLAAANF